MNWFKLKTFIRFYKLAILSALFLLGVTIFIFWETHQRLEERNSLLFDLRVDAVQKAIEKRVTDYIQILKGAQAFLSLNDTVYRKEWKEYVKILNVEQNYPGVQGIGYSLFISKPNLTAFEEGIKKQGFPDFHVWPSYKRPLYSAIVYLEPFNNRNRRAFGYDMFTDSIRREAMKKARDTGKPALSGGVILVQEAGTSIQKGFNLYLPLYKRDSTVNTVAERRKNIVGYVYSPFRVNDLMRGILGSDFNDLEIMIYDEDQKTDNILLFDKKSIDKKDTTKLRGLQKRVAITVAGHTWFLYLAAKKGFGYDRDFPTYLLGGGIVISVLIFMIMLSVGYIKKSNYLKQVITDHATAALFIIDKTGRCTFMNPAAEALTGYTLLEINKKGFSNLFFDNNNKEEKAKSITANGLYQKLPFTKEMRNLEKTFFHQSGKKFYVSISSKPIYQKADPGSILLEVRDISQEKEAESALKERNKTLQTLNNIGANLSAELELKKLLQVITDSCTELTGAELGAFFYNKVSEPGESLMLYTLSGVDPKSFENFPMPRNTSIFATTFHGEGIIRSDDITKDPRYGRNAPYKGIPEDHLPVKSYLAVPVISRNGEVIGGLFFGHTETGVFDENKEEIVKGIAAQAAIAIDNSRLFETITNKNKELTKINNDLDNFVYTASHDLKAPVLNIEGLVYMLTKTLKENNLEKAILMIEMIKTSVLKFKETIQALTEVAKTNKNVDDEVEDVNLDALLEDIKLSIGDMIESSGVHIEAHLECPTIYFSKSNLRSVILNLVVNAIKYRSRNRAPYVEVFCTKKNSEILLEVKDNGLGIAEEHYSKIFLMFKRLHAQVEGTGVGLYLVKRIVENYGGTVSVNSELNVGTTFSIVLPQPVKG